MIIVLDRLYIYIYQHYKSHNMHVISYLCMYVYIHIYIYIYVHKINPPKNSPSSPGRCPLLPSIGGLHSQGPCFAGPEQPATFPEPGKRSRAAGNASACHFPGARQARQAGPRCLADLTMFSDKQNWKVGLFDVDWFSWIWGLDEDMLNYDIYIYIHIMTYTDII